MNNTALAFWDDLWVISTADRGVEVKTLGAEPFRIFVVEFHRLHHYSLRSNQALQVTFQIRLFEGTGAIEFVYGDVNFESGSGGFDGGASATVGVQIDSTDYLQYSFDERSLVNNSFIRLARAAGAVQVVGQTPPANSTHATLNAVSVQFSGSVNIDASKISLAYGLEDVTGSAQFTYDPQTYVARLTYPASLRAGDYTLTVRETVTDTVNGLALDGDFDGVPGGDYVARFAINTPPVLEAIPNATINEAVLWQHSLQAQDVDTPAQVLTYDLVTAPAGMVIEAASGVMQWTPGEAQGPGNYNVTARVRDNGVGTLSDTKSFTLTVAEVNTAPAIDPIPQQTVTPGGSVSFQATARDSDIPAQQLAFSLGAGAPPGATIDPATGQFSWTLDGSVTQTVYEITIIVTDNGSPPLSASTVVRVVINTPPTLQPIPNATIDELVPWQYVVQAQDADTPAQVLAYDLPAAPVGMQINSATGLIEWTPKEGQGPGAYSVTVRVRDSGIGNLSDVETFTLNVAEVNTAPAINPIPTQTITQGAVSFRVTAADADVPQQQITFSLAPGAPAGAIIDPVTGEFSWTLGGPPTQASYTVTVVATDNGVPALSSSRTVNIVAERTLALHSSQPSVIEGGSITATVSIGVALPDALGVSLTASDADRLTFPALVVIPAGQTSASFEVGAAQNQSIQLPVNVALHGSAAGHPAATFSLQVLDDDAPAIRLVLDNSTVSEGGGAEAVRGSLVLSPPVPVALSATFTASANGQVLLPQTLAIPANTPAVTVPITIVDNAVMDGERTITIVARLFNGVHAIGEAPPTSLTITDDEGPSLALTFDRTVLIEGTNPAATGTISREPVNGAAVTVTLVSSHPSKLVTPATVSIPAGEASTSFPLQALSDGQPSGNQPVALAASAPGHSGATASLIITDIQKPDLAVDVPAPPAGGETEAWIDVRIWLRNQGALEAQGPYTQRIFVSSDALPGSDILLAQADFSGRMLAGSSLEQTLRVRLPRASGRYWLVAETDANRAVDEVLENNNLAISATPIDVAPAYSTTLSIAPETVPSGMPIPITGSATLRSGAPAAYALVNIHITSGDIRRVISALTDGSGFFNATFTPLVGEGGLFRFGAAHPGLPTAPVQDEVRVYGLRAEPAAVTVTLTEGTGQAGQVSLVNLADLPLSGLTLTTSDLPAGVQFTPNLSATSVAPSGSVSLNYSISAQASLPPKTFSATITSAEGARAVVMFTVSVTANRPLLVAEPGEIVGGMLRGQQQFISFNVRNNGRAATGPVNILLPAGAGWLRLATPVPLPPLGPGDSVPITLQLLPPVDLPLEEFSGRLVATDGTNSLAIPFKLRALSDQTGTLTVRAEDEYTYYAQDNPPLAGASVTVTDAISRQPIATLVTDAAGLANFGALREGYYEIEVRADRHSTFRANRLIRPGVANQVRAFLSRQTVTYDWSVTPTQIPDQYAVRINTTFETAVPVPVITMEPAFIDFAEITADETIINLKISNHGLIAAEQAQLRVGTHPLWKVTPLISDVGTLPAMSSITIPVRIERLPAARGVPGLARPSFGIPCLFDISLDWSLVCGPDRRWYRVPLPTLNFGGDACGPPGPGGSGGGGGGGGGDGSPGAPYVGSSQTPVGAFCATCDSETFQPTCHNGELALQIAGIREDILELINKAIPRYLTLFDAAVEFEVGGELCDCCTEDKLGRSGEVGAGITGRLEVGLGVSLPDDLLEWEFSGLGYDEIEVELNAFAGVRADGEGRGEVKLEWECYDIFPELCAAFSLGATVGPTIEITADVEAELGNVQWEGQVRGYMQVTTTAQIEWDGCEDVKGRACYGDVVAALGLEGTLTNPAGETRRFEYSRSKLLLQGNCPASRPPALQTLPLERAGVPAAPPAYEFTRAAADYLGPLGKFDGRTIGQVLGSEPPPDSSEVCAAVKLRLDQDVVLARDAFRARLELANSGTDSLENLKVDVAIRPRGESSPTELFDVRLEGVSGLTGVDGEGTLPAEAVGTANWQILPTVDAAPTVPKEFLVGGLLSYTVGGVGVSVPFAEVPITVLPPPRLTLKYFHQRDVFSDDPFTTAIEPAIPYSLAVMVENRGAGIARDFQITSAQPKIVDNERGLLVDFKIIAARVAGQALQPSLTAKFGDINAGQITIGEWLMTSSLQGLFIDYDATFEHLSGNGNPRLSLIDSVEIHEMNHQVRALGAADDGLPDFLVNDVPDARDLPDTLHLSNGSTAPVVVLEQAQISAPVGSEQLTVHLTAAMGAGWNYLRVPEPADGQYTLMSVRRSDGRDIPLNVNVWVTDRTFIGQGRRPIYENILHLLDQDSPGSYTLTYAPKPGPDTIVPSSRVIPLAAQSALEFAVSWEGTDDRGIAHFDVYVSVNGAPFQLWLQRTRDGGAIYVGELGNSYAFYSRATDAAGNAELAPATADTSTTVSVQNLAPTLAAIPDREVIEGEPFVLDLVASDPDGETNLLRFAFTSAVPPGLTIDPQTGQVHWVTGEGDGGREVLVEVTVTDAGVPAQLASRSFTIRVLETNQAPRLNEIAPQRVAPGDTLIVDVNADDADLPQQTIRYELRGPTPAGMVIESQTGLISWQPGNADANQILGVTVATIDSGSPALETLRTFSITVDPVILDRAPLFHPTAAQFWFIGTTNVLEVAASDPDGDPVTMTLNGTGLPSGLSFSSVPGSGRGILTWDTSGNAAGVYSLPFRATAGALETQHVLQIRLVRDNAYWRWAIQNFSDVADPALADPIMDADADGSVNIFEWALLRNPRIADATPLRFTLDGPIDDAWYSANLSIHRRRGSHEFVTLVPEFAESFDATSWFDLPTTNWDAVLDPNGDDDGDPETEDVLVRILLRLGPDGVGDKGFFRLKAATRPNLP